MRATLDNQRPKRATQGPKMAPRRPPECWVGLRWVELAWAALGWAGLRWAEQARGWAGVGRAATTPSLQGWGDSFVAGLGWTGLRRDGLDWAFVDTTTHVPLPGIILRATLKPLLC